MTDLRKQIDELAAIKADMGKLKERKDKLEAEILNAVQDEFNDKKIKSVKYSTEKAVLTVTNAETVKITAANYLKDIFGTALDDYVNVSVSRELSAAGKRLIAGLYKNNYETEWTVNGVIDMMPVSDEAKSNIKAKCKGKNYIKDVENISHLSGLTLEDAQQYAFWISEAAVGQAFLTLMKSNKTDSESDCEDIINKIHAAFEVEDIAKLKLEVL